MANTLSDAFIKNIATPERCMIGVPLEGDWCIIAHFVAHVTKTTSTILSGGNLTISAGMSAMDIPTFRMMLP